jgi:membrane-associated progesterone receptor component
MSFAPKQPVDLQPAKDDIITRDYLAKCDGALPSI